MSKDNEVELSPAHFTESFVERLLLVLSTIPSRHAGGVSIEDLYQLMQSRVGAVQQTMSLAVSCLITMRLITNADGVLARSASGDRVRRQLRSEGSYPLAIAIIRSGLMASQIRAIHGVLQRDDSGYVCSRRAAQVVAPQLIGLLARMPDVNFTGRLVMGRDSALELDSMWNELAPSSRTDWEDIEKRRKAVGERAELYSMQLERSAHVGGRERVVWVSRDDDSLGYDIEVRDQPTRHVEVKGSAGRDVQFLLSANEYRVAQHHGHEYEIQFWGGINLRSDPREDYEKLTGAGFPIRILNPFSTLSSSPWAIEPSMYRVWKSST